MTVSRLDETLKRLSERAASSVVARGRLASAALNAALLRRLSASPGEADAFLADPVFEVASTWEATNRCLGDLSGELLQPELVEALDSAGTARMPRDLRPWSHQIEAWTAAREGLSCLVSSGTGSGKTECFMVPMLDALLRDSAAGLLTGVRAIVVYPLNALIESQRERLAAWTAPLKGRLRFALYNGLTPETRRKEDRSRLADAEIGNRAAIRETPPAILVTNITMLEYLLLRAQDRPILDRSQGLLRWIVLDEAHGYVGAQAAEMALLLRRVRAAFGVEPQQIQLMATSATIGEGTGTEAKLKRFTADLAGVDEVCVRVIQGRTVDPEVPKAGPDTPLEPAALDALDPRALWGELAPHPRIHRLKREISQGGAALSRAAEVLFGCGGGARRSDAQAVLDAAARAQRPETGARLLPWRAHIFHRAQGGLWVCVDPSCPHRDPELILEDADWGFGAVWLRQRDRCQCSAPVFELVACNECGTPHLEAGYEAGATARIVPRRTIETDDFAVDAEPEGRDDADGTEDELSPREATNALELGPGKADDAEDVKDDASLDQGAAARGRALLAVARGDATDRFLRLDDGIVFDNAPPANARWARILLIEEETARDCCAAARTARLAPQRYGPPFLMGTALPVSMEVLARPVDEPGRPLNGRRALTFSDSRQGTARLAAKLQQDAERNLTRAFLYHAVQQKRGPDGAERARLEEKLDKFRKIDDPAFAEDVQSIERQLSGAAEPIPWTDLVNALSQQHELRDFATDVWRERSRGRDLTDDPAKLAEMFLYRELFRRPKVQNSAETLGLVRLSFPTLEKRANATVPRVLAATGVDAEGWTALALAAVDFVFRARLAIHLSHDWMMPFVSPRSARPSSICSQRLARSERPVNSRAWPGPIPHAGRPSRLHALVYALIEGDSESRTDQDRAEEVFAALWSLVVSTAARDVGGGVYQLDMKKAAVVRLQRGWLCPVTRRVLGYSPAGCSPYDPGRPLEPIDLPRLPKANPAGLDPESRAAAVRWCQNDPDVAALRRRGIWTDLHDRAAAYARFLRAQEHSAQIERPVLANYEQRFKDGRINVLNCSTTMEMGIDIPDVQLVVNGNAPPSIANYRQRLGRAGRRGEPWAFGMTFCRDLPLDRVVFDDPERFLAAPMRAPAVRLDSGALVGRHVHAALLGAFLRDQDEGVSPQASTGAFFGATDDAEHPVAEGAVADRFLDALRGAWGDSDVVASDLEYLTQGTVLEGSEMGYLTAETAEVFEKVLRRWRAEYADLLVRRDVANASSARDAQHALALRARRMKGEFLLGELARRGFTPSYGFPVDVVTFDHLSGRDRRHGDGDVTFGDRRGGASRTLDMAIREYAPGAEIVVDGLVHRSEGILPAWSTTADASRLEDLQVFWECSACRAFGVERLWPESCPVCDAPNPRGRRSLRPAGFLGRRTPHTGYENLGRVPYEMPRLSAAGATWRALPDPGAGRWRADPQGQVVTLGSGPDGKGYAICMECGRAEAEEAETANGPLPGLMKRHRPLAGRKGAQLKGGHCAGGYTRPERVQRNVRLVHETRTDVFELQLPVGAGRSDGLALAAGLREALAERLGAEADEIGVAVGRSRGPAGENSVSAFLYDRAPGGAGLSTRLAEESWLDDCLKGACDRLHCATDCAHGCPACVLRPDLNFDEERLDRPAGLRLVGLIRDRLHLPATIQVLGPATRLLSVPVAEWLDQRRRAGKLVALTLYLHGGPAEWELADWPVEGLLGRLADVGVRLEIVVEDRALTDKGMTLAQTLDLHRLSARTTLGCAAKLPFAQGAPVVAVVAEEVDDVAAVAACALDEAVPGPKWGLGEQAPLVQGSAPELPATRGLAADRLATAFSGNAHFVAVRDRLDGRPARFGTTFWKVLASEAPLAVGALRTYGVREVTYVDRYLRSPLAFRLLVEVIRCTPGASGGNPARLHISTARRTREELERVADRPRWAVYHDFTNDKMCRDVLQAMLPGAEIDVRGKAELPHERSLGLRLGDGRCTTILLDQGFGAWRTSRETGPPRHDFGAEPSRQARSLLAMDFKITVEAGREAPIVLTEWADEDA